MIYWPSQQTVKKCRLELTLGLGICQQPVVSRMKSGTRWSNVVWRRRLRRKYMSRYLREMQMDSMGRFNSQATRWLAWGISIIKVKQSSDRDSDRAHQLPTDGWRGSSWVKGSWVKRKGCTSTMSRKAPTEGGHTTSRETSTEHSPPIHTLSNKTMPKATMANKRWETFWNPTQSSILK